MHLMDSSKCWCGSGQTWTDCHRDREFQARIPRHKIHERLKANRRRLTCQHFNAPAECSGGLSKAHSIQRASLDHIARDGKVYQYSGDFGDLLKTGGRLSIRPVGVNRATTFGGFCSQHDNDLFRVIDVESFRATEEVVALHAYRALAREVWARANALYTIPFYRELDRGRSVAEQHRIQALLDSYSQGLSQGSDSLRAHKAIWDACLRSSSFADVRFVIFESPAPAVVLCSGVLLPQYDFQGRTIQDLASPDTRRDLMSVNVIRTDQGSATVLAWHATSDASCERFCRSLASCPNPEREIPEALLRLVLSTFENTAISPVWWDALAVEGQTELLARFEYLGHPLTPPDPEYLMPDRRNYIAPPLTVVRTNIPMAF